MPETLREWIDSLNASETEDLRVYLDVNDSDTIVCQLIEALEER